MKSEPVKLGRDNKSVPLPDDYSFAIYEGKLTVFSECCSSEVSKEAAVAIRDLINEWLEANG